MKTLSFTLLVAIGVLSSLTALADNYAGIVGNMNFARITTDQGDAVNEQIDQRMLPGFGAVLGFGLSDATALHLEPSYQRKGARITSTNEQNEMMESDLTASYLEVPVLLRHQIGNGGVRPFVLAGATFGYNLDSQVTLGSADDAENVDIKDLTSKYDIGLAIGGGLNIPMSPNGSALFLDARYIYGMTDILKDGAVDIGGDQQDITGEAKNRGVQFKAGVTIPFGSSS